MYLFFAVVDYKIECSSLLKTKRKRMAPKVFAAGELSVTLKF